MRTTRSNQRGFVHFPDGFFEALFVLAAIGVIAALAGVGYLLWWLVTHIRFV